MTTRRTVHLALLAALMLAVLAIAPRPTSAASDPRNGNIVYNHITSLSYDPRTSNATIGGKILCSAPTQLTVYGVVSQYRASGKHVAQYYGGIELLCETKPTRYSVTVTRGYESARLLPGLATVGFWAEYYADGNNYGFPTYKDMRLKPRW